MASGDGERERAIRLALVPGVAYVAAATAGEVAVDGGPLVVLTIPVLAAGSAIFVAAPAFVALAAARHRLVRAVVLAVVTATAAVAGVLVTTSDDAQAGLAALWVPYVALPLALVVWLGHEVSPHAGGAAHRREAGWRRSGIDLRRW